MYTSMTELGGALSELGGALSELGGALSEHCVLIRDLTRHPDREHCALSVPTTEAGSNTVQNTTEAQRLKNTVGPT